MSKKIVTYDEFLEALKIVRQYKEQVKVQFDRTIHQIESISSYINVDPKTPIYKLPLAKRTLNVIKNLPQINYLEDTLEDLSNISMSEMLKTKNAGVKTMNEIQELCLYTGITMKT